MERAKAATEKDVLILQGWYASQVRSCPPLPQTYPLSTVLHQTPPPSPLVPSRTEWSRPRRRGARWPRRRPPACAGGWPSRCVGVGGCPAAILPMVGTQRRAVCEYFFPQRNILRGTNDYVIPTAYPFPPAAGRGSAAARAAEGDGREGDRAATGVHGVEARRQSGAPLLLGFGEGVAIAPASIC